MEAKRTRARRGGKCKCGHADGRRHDCSYVESRSMIAQIAEHAADARWGDAPAGIAARAAWARRWDAEFHRVMERLMHDPFMKARLAQRGVA